MMACTRVHPGFTPPKELPGHVAELIGFAIAAAEQVHENLVGELGDRDFAQARVQEIALAPNPDCAAEREREVARRRDHRRHVLPNWSR